MMDWLPVALALALVWLVSYLSSLLLNYYQAKKTGFPVLVCPINPSNPVWMVVGVAMHKILHQVLPAPLWQRIRFSLHGWEAMDAERKLDTPGRSFILVTPGRNELWIQDPEVAELVLTRREGFVQAAVTARLIRIFGENTMTTDGHDWLRHRKLVHQSLNERIMTLVWDKSQEQAHDMLQYFLEHDNGQTDETVNGLRQIAVNVLASAGYGGAPSWKATEDLPPPGHKLSYVQVLNALTDGFVLIAFLPKSVLSSRFLPEGIQKIGVAAREFPGYTKEALLRERASSAEGDQPRKTFISALVKNSDELKRQADVKDPSSRPSLSEDEIMGNLFQFTLAGFDTTANTLAYAVTLLAVHPEWQNWIIEEIDNVLGRSSDLTYGNIFPRLERCLALMFETLRLYTPVSNFGRTVASSQILNTSSGRYSVPANMNVYLCAARMHTDKELWGEAVLDFNPARWVADLGPDRRLASKASGGKFLPWSAGPRICPGLKMSQVEFLSVISTLFRQATVKPAIREGETAAMATERIKAVMKDSLPRLTLQMNRPNDVKLIWEKRS